VTLHDRSSYAARVVGSYAKLDISLIRISADKKLPSVQLGNSDKLEVGDWVMAIGNPFGLDHTVTTGIISAKGRVIGAGPYDDFLQTDASINPGNSGGPLFNLAGEVIGINTAILQNGRGIGFAIPVNMAREIVDKLTGKKGTEQAWIGLRTQELTPQLARSFGLKSLDGVLVSEVFYDSPAYRAGIEVGDIIVSFAETPVETPSDFRRLLATVEPYTNVPLEIVRYNRRYRLKLAVVSQP
ncbi:MAG: S1C family serine protease, partial [bacterium]